MFSKTFLRRWKWTLAALLALGLLSSVVLLTDSTPVAIPQTPAKDSKHAEVPLGLGDFESEGTPPAPPPPGTPVPSEAKAVASSAPAMTAPGSIVARFKDSEGADITADIYFFVSQSRDVPGRYLTARQGQIEALELPAGRYKLCLPRAADPDFNGGYPAQCFNDQVMWDLADWIIVEPGRETRIDMVLYRDRSCPNEPVAGSQPVGGC